MHEFYKKLSRLRHDIQRWNKYIFGNIFNEVAYGEEQVRRAETAWEQFPTEDSWCSYNQAKAEYIHATIYEFQFWKQKARVRWFQDGDANSKYFHSLVKDRRAQLRIQQIYTASDMLCDTLETIQNEALSFYRALFAKEPTGGYDSIVQYIPHVVTTDDNALLTHLPLAEEIKDALWQLDPQSAAGPDGFNGNFFRSILEYYISGCDFGIAGIFSGHSSTFSYGECIDHIDPEVQTPRTFSDFGPICLSNFLTKLCTRIIATRLSMVLSKLILPEGTGILKGHDISSQVLLA